LALGCLVVFLVGGFTQSLWAQSASTRGERDGGALPCLALPAPWASLNGSQKKSLQSAAEQAAPECANNAQYLVVLAWLAMEQGDDFRALAHAERAVLLAPNVPAVRLDYGLLLAKLGYGTLARAVVEDLLRQPGLPQGLETELRAWRNQSPDLFGQVMAVPGNGVGLQLRHQSRVYAGWGASTNVNNGLSADRIRLTLPTEVIEFPLNKQDKAIAGNLLEWGGEGQWLLARSAGSNNEGQAAWGLVVSASGVHPTGRSSFTSQSVVVAARAFSGGLQQLGLYQALGEPVGLELKLGSSWYGHERLVQTLGTTTAWGLLPPASLQQCQPEVGLSADARRYPNAPVFDHWVFRLALGAVCRQQGLEGRLGLFLSAEEPRNQRPGGGLQRLGVETSLAWPRSWGRLMGQLQVEYEEDKEPYSALLENGTRKRALLTVLGLQALIPIKQGVGAYSRLEYRHQQSNLPLFSSNSFSLGFGLEATFR
jgi:hypothetical protein